MRTAPPRPDEAPAHRREERRWLPAIAVVAVIVFVTGGSQVVGDAIAEPAEPVRVGGVTVTPEPGWEVDSRTEEPGVSSALLRHGSAGLLVLALDGPASAEELARDYADLALRERFAQLTIGQPSVADLGSVRFVYVGITHDGVAVEGVVSAVASGAGGGAIFDGFAPKGSLGAVVDDLTRIVESSEMG